MALPRLPPLAAAGRALALLAAAALAACAHRPPPRASWPTEAWPRATPEARGFRSAALAGVLDEARSDGLPLHGLLVVRGGDLVLEAYGFPYDGVAPHDVASVTKSVTTTLLGVALDRGLLPGLDAPLGSLPGLAPPPGADPRVAAITLGDLAAMASGLACGLSPGEPELHAMMREPAGWPAAVLRLPVADPPGARFAYCSGNMHLLGAAVARAAGRDLADLAREALFAPLGAAPGPWPTDPDGLRHGWGDLDLHPRDMARLGWLFLNEGRWGDAQVVSRRWVRAATRPLHAASATEGYGYGWWTLTGDLAGAYEARGRGGQGITVWPARDVVVVMVGAGLDRAALAPGLLAALASDRPLPPDPAGERRLAEAVAALARPPAPAPVPPAPPLAAAWSGRALRLADNALGVASVTLAFPPGAAEARAEVALGGRSYALAAGLDGVARLSPGPGPTGGAVACRGRWATPEAFELTYEEAAGSNHLVLTFVATPDPGRVTVAVLDRTGLLPPQRIEASFATP